MLAGKDFNHYVAARLRDFFRPGERWFRGLWEVGIVLSLQELVEASEAVAHGVLSQAALDWLTADVKQAVLADVGVPVRLREDFKRVLVSSPSFEDSAWHSLEDLTNEVSNGYLRCCALAAAEVGDVGGKPKGVKAERLARALAAHLLDVGFSQPWLTAWLRQELTSAGEATLPDFVTKLHDLARLGNVSYRVVVPVTTGINKAEAPPDWLQAPDVRAILAKNQLDHSRLRYAGAGHLVIEERDPHSAAQAAFDEVDRRAARLLVGRGQRMAPIGEAFVFGEPSWVRVPRASIAARVRVRSIERQKQLFVETSRSKVDAAFELLAQLDGSSALAVAAGWAAIESLLAGRTGDKVNAGDRLASLVAASFPRAELSSLAAHEIQIKSPLGQQLASMGTKREWAIRVADEINGGSALSGTAWSDRAAVARISALLASPREKLEDVVRHVQRVFRRYYRQRNLVLHWGKTSPVALRACLRTGTPLLAAGVDRIAHAWFLHGIEPIELATRARSRLDLASLPNRRLSDLLEGFES